MAEIPWNDILETQPRQGQRVLVKLIGGMVRLCSYDRYSYEHWCIAKWKSIPEQQDGQQQDIS